MTTLPLPTFEEATEACLLGSDTLLQLFICDNEPVQNDRLWRTQLAAAINEAVLAGVTYRT
jgi:hypothetical protein